MAHTQTRRSISSSYRLLFAALIAAIALVVAACGSDENTTAGDAGSTSATKVSCASGTVSGAGATFPQTIVQQWIKDYGAACPQATVNYQGVGSGAGIQQFTAGTVDFGASDAVMKPDEQQAAEAKGGRVVHVPWTAGAIAVMFNLKDTKSLKLSGETIAAIFAGSISKWDDAKVKADNPGVSLPSTGIQVIHRADGSGTTAVFTSYLTAVAPALWTVGSGKDVAWPAGQGAKGSDGVTAAVKQTEGAIGYAELSFAQANSLGIASVKNAAGEFVVPSAAGVSAALGGADVPDDLKVKVNFAASDPAAYPISTTTWALVFAKYTDTAKGNLVKSFLTYALGPGQGAAERLYYAPLPNDLLTRTQVVVASLQTP
jgi:phosphate transport system substrate-binding protein